MRPTTLLRAAAVAAALVLPAGCGDDTGGGAGADPAASLAAGTPLYVEITVKPQGDRRADAEAALRKVLRTGDPGARLRDLLDGNGLDYTRDIEPWVGERVGFALTGVARDGEPQFVVAMAAADTDRAEESLSRDSHAREYDGTRYRVDREDGFAAGVVGDVVLLSESEAGFRKAVDAAKGDDHLSDAEGFRQARERHGDDHVAFAYADLPRAIRLLATAGGAEGQEADLVLGLLGGSGLRGASLALDVGRDVVRLDGAVDLPKGLSVGGSGDAAGMLERLPAGSLAALGLGDIGKTVEQILTQLARLGGLRGISPDQVISGLKAQYGVDVRRDLLSWMGDAGVVLRGFDAAGPDGAIVIESTDPSRTRAAMPKLARLLEGFGLEVREQADGLILRFDGDFEVDVLARGDRFVIGTGAGVSQALDPDRRLADDPAFKAAAGALEGGTRPLLFADVRKVSALLADLIGRDYAAAKPYVDAFGVLVAGGTVRDGIARGQLAVTLP